MLSQRLWRSGAALLIAVGFVSFSVLTAVGDDAAGQASTSSAASLTVPLGEGDIAVSGFSGARLANPSVPAGVDPLTKTMIDTNGTSLKIFDLSTLGGPTVGQVVDAPLKLALPAAAIGQVFALSIDGGNGGAPNLYVAASSAYGLQIVGAPGTDGVRVRLKQGANGAAFMAGQFGSIPGASPGSIYKIDGTMGAVTLFGDTAFSGVPNTGAGIGGLAFDPVSHDLYASDLDTGLVHRFNTTAPGADLGQFDHGTTGRTAAGQPAVADDGKTANITSSAFVAADPSTWGFTQAQRRVDALAVHNGRLFYAVADGPSVWSVSLNPDGSFGSDPRLELSVQGAQPFPITGLAFDPAGDMVLAQRGTLAAPFDYGQFSAPGAQVLRYAPAPAGGATPWAATPDEYPVGFPDGSRMGAGGAAFADGYNPDGSRGTTCGTTLLTTGDDLRDNAGLAAQLPPGPTNVAGVQVNDATLVAPQNVPPAQSAFLAFDPNANATATGHAGAVAVVSCLGGSAAAAAAVVNPSASAGTSPAAGTTAPATNAQNPSDDGTTAPGPQPDGSGTTAPGTQPSGSGTTAANQPLTVTKAATATTCTEQGGCSFAITVHNPNQSAVPGPFTVEDVFTAGGAQLTQSKLTSGPDAPWTCVSAAAGGSLSCSNPGPIQPGDTTFNLTFAPGETGNATDVVNCAQPGGPNTAPVNLPPVPQATLPPPASTGTEKDNFFVAVEPHNSPCTSADGSCEFDVVGGPPEVPSTAQGPLTFKVTASLGADPAPVKFDATEVSLPKGATCQPEASGEALDCTTTDTGTMNDTDVFHLKVKTTLPASGASALVLHASVQGPVQEQGDASVGIPLTDGTPQQGANPDAGATQQFQAPQCATIALDKTKDRAAPPASIVNGLSIAKAFSKDPGPCTLNSTCSFDITVTNTTNATVPGPLKFTEETALGAGLPLPLTGATATGPFTCPEGGVGLECEDKDSLDAGQSLTETVVVPVTSLLVGPGPQNCATMGLTPSCVPFPTPATSPSKGLTIKKTGPASCAVGTACEYRIAITNTGTTDFPGPVVFSDVGLPGEAKLDGGNIATPSPADALTCTPGNPSTCTFNGAITAGKTQPFDLSFTATGAGGNGSTTVQNCAMLEGDTVDPSCIQVNVTGPKPTQSPPAAAPQPAPTGPQLKVIKLPNSQGPDGVGTCPLASPFCQFVIQIINTGTVPVTGRIEFDDHIQQQPVAEMGVSVLGAGWTCETAKSNTDTADCTAENVTMAPGDQMFFAASVTTGPPWKKDDILTNCVRMGGMGNATLDPSSQLCASVKLDPFNVKIQKGGDQSCQPGADCHFSLTLYNPGPIDHDAPVTISDKLDVGTAPITSISPPLPCAQQPTQVPFTCTSPGNFPLPLGGPPHTYNLTIHLPAGATSYTNCATVGPEPNAGANQELGDRISSTSCVTTAMQPAPAAHLSLKKTGPDTCEPGQPCAFSVTVTNDGNAPFSGRALLSDSLDIGQAAVQGAVALCAAPPKYVPFRCTTVALTLAPGATTSSDVVVVLPASTAASATNCAGIQDAAKGAARTNLPSCATVALNAGTGGTNGVQQQQIPQPQQPSAQPLVPPPSTGGTNPPPTNPLKISKTGPETCTPGTVCNFNIQITRTGPTTGFSQGGIEFDDTLDLGAAQIVSMTPQVCGVAPTQLPIKCDLTQDVAEGQPLSFTIGVMLPTGSATQAINCASTYPFNLLDWLGLFNSGGSNDPAPVGACATVQLNAGNGGTNGIFPGGLNAPHQVPILGAAQPNAAAGLTLLKTADASCTAGGTCNFTLTLLDPSNAPFDGAVEIKDQLNLGAGVPSTLAITTIQPPLPCASQPTQVPFKCDSTHNITVNSGQPQTYHISTVIPANVTAPTLTNCADIGTAVSPDDLPLLYLAPGQPQSCATVNIGQLPTTGGTNGIFPRGLNAPHQVPILGATQPNAAAGLTLLKTADATCTAGGTCNFTLTLLDPSNAPFHGAFEINDQLSLGAEHHQGVPSTLAVTTIQPPLPCATQPTQVPFTCDSTSILTIDSSHPQTYHISTVIPADVTAPTLTNCGDVMTGASPDDLPLLQLRLGQPPQSCATVNIAQLPTTAASLSVTKTASAPSCTPGSVCNFSITLTNNSDAPFNGPVSFHDGLDVGGQAPIASIQPPLPCTTQPQTLPFDCSSGPVPVPVAAGQSVTYQMGVYLPPTTASQITNCVQVQFPNQMLNFGGPQQSCATVQLTPSANTPPAGQPQQCFSNMMPDGNGGCQCPANTFWDGKQCSPGEGGTNGVESQPDTTAACPIGTTGTPPNCQAAISPKAGLPHQVPLLHCPAGTTGTYPNCKAIRTQQVLKCPVGMFGSPPTCSCPTGTHLSSSGRSCIPNPQGTNNQRLCPPGAFGRYPYCRCEAGAVYSRQSNSCVAIQREPAPETENGGPSFPFGFPSGGFNFPMGFPGHHPRNPGGNPSNGGTNTTQQQQVYTCPASEHYSPSIRRCLPNKATTATPAPTPTPAPAPAPSGNDIDFGGCPGCGTDTGPVVK